MDGTTTSTLSVVEREGNALGGLFQNIITDLRAGANNWDDLLLKANKFHIQLKSTISSSTAFLDAFQKIADMATTTRGGTKEIGSALTRLCLRNRSVEAKLKSLTSSLLDSFILPLHDRVDEWKKIIVQIDKEHNKEIKRLKQFRKKHSSETRVSTGFSNNTFRMKRHPRSNKFKTDFPRIGSMYDVDKIEPMDNKEKYFMLEEVERNYVRRALIEERSHYCLFFNLLRPVIEEEISMLQEIIHLEEILTTLSNLTNDPHKLPTSSENFLTNLQLNDSVPLDLAYSEYNSPINNSTISHSRKSSISSMDSFNTLSTDSISFRNVKSLSQPNINPGFRPKSIASQDSGFLSHDYNIPNIGRLVIYNKNKNTQSKDPICILNGKPILCSSRIEDSNDHKKTNEISCDIDQYAISESLFNNNNNHNNTSISNNNNINDSSNNNSNDSSTSLQQSQPIYVNIRDSHPTIRNRYASDGSITPTNQDFQEDNNHYIKPKPCPPKPPVRHSSKLSSKPLDSQSVSEKRSTLIYVQNKETSLDFPPPPPEAYMTTRQSTSQTKMNENLCCRYSVPSSHLVFCDNQDCLKDFKLINQNNETKHYGSQKLFNCSTNGYSFESNLDRTCVDTGWRQQKAVYYETHGTLCNEITNCNHQSQFDPRYHSSVNLSDHRQK